MLAADASFLALATAVVAAWELLSPRRRPNMDLRIRWLGNLTMLVMDQALIRSLFPLFAVGVSVLAADRSFGLFNVLRVPAPIAVAVSVFALDVAKYLEHLAFHRMAILWPIHRMHHTDLDFDFTVGFRFHPAEAVLSNAWTLVVVATLGVPAAGVVIWQVALMGNTVFAHANARMPRRLDRALRLLTVTPDMHRLHHSVVQRENASNLGSLFPWWDRLLGTYVDAPEAGLDAMRIGLDEFPERKHLMLPWMLLHPLLSPASDRAGGVREGEGTEATPGDGCSCPTGTRGRRRVGS